MFFLVDARDKNGQDIIFYKGADDKVPRQVSFHSVLGIEPEEIYQFWAMLAAVISLVVLVAEKAIQLIIPLISPK